MATSQNRNMLLFTLDLSTSQLLLSVTWPTTLLSFFFLDSLFGIFEGQACSAKKELPVVGKLQFSIWLSHLISESLQQLLCFFSWWVEWISVGCGNFGILFQNQIRLEFLLLDLSAGFFVFFQCCFLSTSVFWLTSDTEQLQRLNLITRSSSSN